MKTCIKTSRAIEEMGEHLGKYLALRLRWNALVEKAHEIQEGSALRVTITQINGDMAALNREIATITLGHELLKRSAEEFVNVSVEDYKCYMTYSTYWESILDVYEQRLLT